MSANVGSVDRGIRLVLGLALLSLVFIVKTDARWLGLIGVVPLFTALFRFCPLYTMLGMNTCVSAKRG